MTKVKMRKQVIDGKHHRKERRDRNIGSHKKDESGKEERTESKIEVMSRYLHKLDNNTHS